MPEKIEEDKHLRAPEETIVKGKEYKDSKSFNKSLGHLITDITGNKKLTYFLPVDQRSNIPRKGHSI